MASQFVIDRRAPKRTHKTISTGSMAEIRRRDNNGNLKLTVVGANRAQYRQLRKDTTVVSFELVHYTNENIRRAGWDLRTQSEKVEVA